MCELLGGAASEEDRDRLFTVGLFSVADALLDAPMEEVLASLPFSEEITGALLRYEGRRGAHARHRAALRAGPLPATGDGDPVELAEAYLAALRWADDARVGWLGARIDARGCRCGFKLTLAFTGVMAVLLAGAGIALSVLVAQNLDSTIDDGLAARAGDAAAPSRRTHGDRQLAQHRRAVRAGARPGRRGARHHDRARARRSLLDARRSSSRRADGDVIVERRRATASSCGCWRGPCGAAAPGDRSSSASRSPSASGRSTRCTRCWRSAARWRC